MTAAAGRETVLQVSELRAYFRNRSSGVVREVPAVDGISFDVRRNEIYGIAGESSSGKTTLIKTIAGLARPPLEHVGGSARFAFLPGYDVLSQAPAEIAREIRWSKLSYIMQGSMNVLNPLRRIKNTFADFAARHLGGDGVDFRSAVTAHLAKVGLDASLLDAYPHELSGGMRQRVTIALATICRPEFIIADEPTTALDVVVQKEVLSMMRTIQQDMMSSILFVTHDLGVHAALTDRIGIMYAGRMVEEASTRHLFAKPLHPYSAHLIGSLPRIGDATRRTSLGGSPPNLADPPPGCRFHPRCPIAMPVCRTVPPPMVARAGDRRVACHAVTGVTT